MFSRDVLVLHLLSTLLCRGKNLGQARAEILLTALHARETPQGRFAIVLDYLNVGAKFSQQWPDNAFRLLQHCAQNMLGLNLLVLVSLGELYAGLNRFLAAKCEFI